MIPLASWLRDCRSQEPGKLQPPHGESPPLAIEQDDSEDGVGKDLVQRLRELEEALATSVESAQQERHAAATRERELSQRLGEELASRLGQDIRSGLMQLQADIELALCDVLAPFLEQQSCRRSVDDLRTMIAQSLSDTTEPLVEVRAPGPMHDAVRSAIEEAGLQIDLLEGHHIELTIGTQVTRFEGLASRWIEVLKEHGT